MTAVPSSILRSVIVASMLSTCSLAHAVDVRSRSPEPRDVAVCESVIRSVETNARVPPGLLRAIGLVESPRLNVQTGRVAPWPWAINVAGAGFFFESKEDAIAAVNKARAAGTQSIDVGCMQINLLHHPDAFASLDQAFDPRFNVSYAASFLSRLFVQTGTWPNAAAAYHSQTPGLADDYRKRVLAVWPDMGRYASDSALDDERSPALRARLATAAVDRGALTAARLLPAYRPGTSRISGLAAETESRLLRTLKPGVSVSAASPSSRPYRWMP